jgi:N-carbamoyl-L-amino-acid hydrolase
MSKSVIDGDRLLGRLKMLGTIGRSADGALTRLAASDEDKKGRDALVGWVKAAGLEVRVDRIGNVFGIWRAGDFSLGPVLMGSHIDTVINAGIYDGCYGVLSALEVIETLKAIGFAPKRSLAMCAFTGEEGVRFAPDMIGSLTYAGGLELKEALATRGTDGAILGDELDRIGYAGDMEIGSLRPYCYVELHIEQGPVLEHENYQLGAVQTIQGISWQRITIDGEANHAGTTPMNLRCDAGLVAARIATHLRDHIRSSNAPTVATVGTIRFEPNAINVIPSRAILTVDLRDPDEARLQQEEDELARLLAKLEKDEGVSIATERLARFEPVNFDARIVTMIEATASSAGLRCRRITSGAGHDAQMMARLAPTAMIFVPSIGGISHSPKEFTPEKDLIAGAQVLLNVAAKLASE